MKKAKIILSSIACLAAIGTAFAINSSKVFATHPVYTSGGTFTGCYLTAAINCGRTALSTDYYTLNGVRQPITVGQQLKKD